MNILILTPGIFPDDYGGLPKLVFYLARQLSRLGHEIIILTRKYEKHHPDYTLLEGMHCFRLFIPKQGDFFHIAWPFFTSVRAFLGMSMLKEKYPHFDIVWTHNPWWTLLRDPRKLWPKAKLIYDFHADGYGEIVANYGDVLKARLMGRLYDAISARCVKKSDFVIAHSCFMKARCLAQLKLQCEEKINVVPGGADTELYQPVSASEKRNIKKKLSLPLDKTIFVTARGLKTRTGVDKLIEAAAMLKRKECSFFLNVIGDGQLKPLILQKIAHYGLTDVVRLVSNLSETELVEYYQGSDVFVLPTQSIEGFGLATVEALSTGLVVLGTNNSATPEILQHYHPRWLMKGSDAEAIFQSLFAYCQHPEQFFLPQEEIRRTTLEHYAWTTVAKKFLDTLYV